MRVCAELHQQRAVRSARRDQSEFLPAAHADCGAAVEGDGGAARSRGGDGANREERAGRGECRPGGEKMMTVQAPAKKREVPKALTRARRIVVRDTHLRGYCALCGDLTGRVSALQLLLRRFAMPLCDISCFICSACGRRLADQLDRALESHSTPCSRGYYDRRGTWVSGG
jgi:hypothetical protein